MPDKSQEVKVHAPEEFGGGGKSASGKLVIKPESFVPVRFQPVTVALIVATVLGVLALAWGGGRTGLFSNPVILTVGLLAISPLLVVAAYGMLRDAELEPYRGMSLYLRACICGLAYAALWGVFAMLVSRGIVTGELWNWCLVAPPMVIVGGMFAMASLDLDFGDAMLHYGFYVLVTVVLRWIAGMKWVWNI
ncbi:MAG: hypothetical protein LLF97_10370 [Planctomycetaceae bacterium]|nr:hypothetical protein [Planctomycetaceae bacterium]